MTHQASLAKRVVNLGLSSVTGLPAADLAKRPFLLFWFMSQIERCVNALNAASHVFLCLTSPPHIFPVAAPILSLCLILWRLGPDGLLAPTCGVRWISRALSLWSYDRTLSVALDVAKTLSKPVEYLMTLWPCPGTRRKC